MMRILAPTLFVVILLAGCQAGSNGPGSSAANDTPLALENEVPFRSDGSLTILRGNDSLLTLDIEIADTDSARERGMMQRSGLPHMSGMLFLMPTEEVQGFWMSNTQVSLDIIFANGEGEIVSISKYAKPLSPETLWSEAPAEYILEVMAGFADEQGITKGDVITWKWNALEL